jgi:pimeloyl-ACP methyl ester carboxylesterase
MPFLDCGSHRLHYELHGPEDAPPLLLLMGLGLSARAWDLLPARLSDRFRVVAFDNRGTGRSSCRPAPFRITHLADDAAAVLDAAGVERAGVFGISMGGMIALELALRHGDRVHALALGATHAGWLRSRKPTLGTLAQLLYGALLGRPTERFARILVSGDHLADDGSAFRTWFRNAEHARTITSALQVAAVALHATESRIARIRVPTLVITGDGDRLVPPENSFRLAERIEGSRLVVLPGAGHCFPVERLDETVEALRDHFGAAFARAAAPEPVPSLPARAVRWIEAELEHALEPART